MKPKPTKESITIMSHLMMPADANTVGFVHGGVILKLVDIISYICASKHSGKYCVTASIDRVNFLQPIRIGELVILYASVNYVGNTSMEVGVRVEAENLRSGKRRHTNSCYVTMVSVSNKGKPIKAPKVIPQTKEEKLRYEEAEKRRKERLMKKAKI
ncbi:MAG: acyl-CoA thioesterase [Nanoarchaeota archaeon]|nr:acyl-CoA thioesterase [Nanoarchaeota archaeon]